MVQEVQGFPDHLLDRKDLANLENQVHLNYQLVPEILVGPVDQEHLQILGVQCHQLSQRRLVSQAAQAVQMDLSALAAQVVRMHQHHQMVLCPQVVLDYLMLLGHLCSLAVQAGQQILGNLVRQNLLLVLKPRLVQ